MTRKNRFSVTEGDRPVERARDRFTDVGHYFDQVTLDRENRLMAARAATLALNEELIRLGVVIDPATGEVTLKRA